MLQINSHIQIPTKGHVHRVGPFVRLPSTATCPRKTAHVLSYSKRNAKHVTPLAQTSTRRASHICHAATLKALIFDCDGVILESEDLHRRAYNAAFMHFDVRSEKDGRVVQWSEEFYNQLQNKIGGGKPKMRWFFGQHDGWPSSTIIDHPPATEEEQTRLIDTLQDWKTEKYQQMIGSGEVPARPGVVELMDSARARGLRVAVCSAATKSSVVFCLENLLGMDRFQGLDLFMAGDDVPRKKPDPIIYQLAAERLGLSPEECCVVEDSTIGLQAALGAGMRCIITYTSSTQEEAFTGAERIVEDVVRGGVTVEDLMQPPAVGVVDDRVTRATTSSLTISNGIARMLSLTGFKGVQQLVQTSVLHSQRSFVHQHRLQPRVKTVIVRAAAAPFVSMGFGQLGLGNEIIQALDAQGIHEPTEVQTMAIPRVLQKTDTLIASHTGSGKTLAYYLPMIQLLRDQEATAGIVTRPKRPRAIVLGPTRELTDQITAVGKAVSHYAKFSSGCINGGGEWGKQRTLLEKTLDVLVATPTRLIQHWEKGNVYLGDVQVVVLDEADTMLDAGFGPEVNKILTAVRSKQNPASVVFVAATLNKQVSKLLDRDFPTIARAATSSLHKGVAGAQHNFLPLTAEQNKLLTLTQILEADLRSDNRVMIFCNTLPSCRAVEHYLSEAGVPTRCYHGDVPLDQRRQAIADFAGTGGGGEAYKSEAYIHGQPVLVCTDLAARGLDIPGRVDHVVNFDFPLNPVDYIHRSGRTARAGNRGRITSLVVRGDRVLATRIEEALREGRSLDELSADRHVLPPNMRPKKETLERQNLERKAIKAARKGLRGAARVEMLQRGAQPSDDQVAKHLRDGKKRGDGKKGPPKSKGGKSLGVGSGRPGVGRSGGGGGTGRRRGVSSRGVGGSSQDVGIAVRGAGKRGGGPAGGSAFVGGTGVGAAVGGPSTGPRGAAGTAAALKMPKKKQGAVGGGRWGKGPRKNMPSDKH